MSRNNCLLYYRLQVYIFRFEITSIITLDTNNKNQIKKRLSSHFKTAFFIKIPFNNYFLPAPELLETFAALRCGVAERAPLFFVAVFSCSVYCSLFREAS